ncbi:12351_t:CDS:2, partial [Acaulospora morrowiae]
TGINTIQLWHGKILWARLEHVGLDVASYEQVDWFSVGVAVSSSSHRIEMSVLGSTSLPWSGHETGDINRDVSSLKSFQLGTIITLFLSGAFLPLYTMESFLKLACALMLDKGIWGISDPLTDPVWVLNQVATRSVRRCALCSFLWCLRECIYSQIQNSLSPVNFSASTEHPSPWVVFPDTPNILSISSISLPSVFLSAFVLASYYLFLTCNFHHVDVPLSAFGFALLHSAPVSPLLIAGVSLL